MALFTKVIIIITTGLSGKDTGSYPFRNASRPLCWKRIFVEIDPVLMAITFNNVTVAKNNKGL